MGTAVFWMKLKKAVLLALVIVLLSTAVVVSFVRPAVAEATIYIRADGSIDPPTAPISIVDYVTYYFTGNITDSIVVERSNIIVDGKGYTVHGLGMGNGFYLQRINNVTVKNTNIKDFWCGIRLDQDSSGNSFSGNTITGNSEHGILIEWRSNYNSIEGNTIANNSLYGIKVNGFADYQSITGNMVIDNGGGIDICDCSYNNIVGNIIANNSGHGIQIGGSWHGASAQHGFSYNNSISENTIADNKGHGILLGYDYANSATNCSINRNIIENNDCGIWVSSTTDNSIIENSIAYNGYGVWLYSSSNRNVVSGNTFMNDGLTVWDSYQNVVENNTVNGKPLVYLEGVANHTVNIAGQVILVNCTGIRVESLNLSRTDIGVQLWQTSNSSIASNSIANSPYGISLSFSSGNSVVGNIVTANVWHGISFAFSSGNIASENNIADNYYGLWLGYSSNNSFYHNNFIDNSQQVNVSSGYANVWDDGYPSGGNYWSNYNGTDANQDGIGEPQYIIDSNNNDAYPLMGMFSDFQATSEHHVQTICNSTISDFHFNGTAIRFNVSGEDGTTGFCRILIPTALMGSPYTVYVNGSEVDYTLLPFSNSTNSYLYFTYRHSTEEVMIIPESPTWASMLLTLILLTVAIAIYKRRLLKTPIH